MRQGTNESAADFLVRVSSAIESLAQDFKGAIPKEEFDTILYDVSFNGVNKDYDNILDSDKARHGYLDADRMYEAVKTQEAYLAHSRCLNHAHTSSSTTTSTLLLVHH